MDIEQDSTTAEPLLGTSNNNNSNNSNNESSKELFTFRNLITTETIFPLQGCAILRIVGLTCLTLFLLDALLALFVFAGDNLKAMLMGIFIGFFIIYPAFLLYCWFRFRRLGPIGFLRSHTSCVSLCIGGRSGAVANHKMNLARCYEAMNKPEEALRLYKSIEIDFSTLCRKPPGGVKFYRSMGAVLFRLGRLEDAIEAFEKAVSVQRMQRKTAIKAQTLTSTIASIYERMGNMEKSLEKRQEAWKILLEADQGNCSNSMSAGGCLVRLAATHKAMGNQQLSLETLQKALGIYLLNEGEFPSSNTVARLYCRIGDLQVEMGRIEQGKESYNLAIDVYRRGGMSDDHATLFSLIGKADSIHIL